MTNLFNQNVIHKVIIPAILCISLNNVQAQNSEYQYQPQKIDPPSVASFKKFDFTDVEMSRGIANVSVPITTISMDEFNMPIEISYNTKGIKVADESGFVGLGWDMNLPNIRQEINDDDDLGFFHDQYYRRQILPHQGNVSPNRKDLKHRKLGGSVGSTYGDSYLQSGQEKNENILYYRVFRHNIPMDNQIFDTELVTDPSSSSPYIDIYTKPSHYFPMDSQPDYFTINLNGKVVKFIYSFEDDGYEIKILNEKIYHIVYNKTDKSFIVTSPERTKYYFTLKTEGWSGFSERGNLNTDSYNHTYSIWYVSKVVTAKGNEINFEYYQFPYSNTSIYKKTSFFQQQTETGELDIRPEQSRGYVDFLVGGAFGHSSGNSSFSSHDKIGIYLKNIYYAKGKVTFDYTEREDMYNLYEFKKLDNIKVFDVNYTPVFNYKFNYTYFTAINTPASNNWRIPNQYDNKRLKLDFIELNNKPYRRFNYSSQNLPSKVSYAVDFWGYNNGQYQNESYTPNAQRFINAGIIAGVYSELNNNNNKSSLRDFAEANILKEIIFPTGGKEIFNYELNEYTSTNYNKVPNYSDNNVIVKGNGLRVASKLLVDSNNTELKKIEYVYEQGNLPMRLTYFHTFNYTYMNPGLRVYFRQGRHANSINYYDSQLLVNNDNVYYGKVTEKSIDLLNNGNSFHSIYYFENNNQKYSTVGQTNFVDKIYDPVRADRTKYPNGTLLRKENLNSSNIKILEEEFEYNKKQSYLTYGNQTYGGGLMYAWYVFGSNTLQFLIDAIHNLNYYPIYYDKIDLKKKTSIEYFNGGSSQTTMTDYGYDEYDRLITTSTYIQDHYDERLRERFVYSSTIPATIGQISRYKGNDNFRTEYFLHQTIGSGSNAKYLPKSYHKCPYAWYPPFDICQNIINEEFNAVGNVTKYKIENDGSSVRLVWGYGGAMENGIYLIAKIENPEQNNSNFENSIANAINVSNGETNNCFGSDLFGQCQEAMMRGTFDRLRKDFPSSLVTSYTYDPLKGVTSITQPNGQIEYYRYDDLGRLQFIYDHNEKLLKKIDYNYKQ